MSRQADRKTEPCTLPRVNFAESGVKGSWPICYDYLADQTECPKIDVTGLVSAIPWMKNCAHALTPPVHQVSSCTLPHHWFPHHLHLGPD
jgi:hypothetical protein